MSVWKITGEVDRGARSVTVYREYTQDTDFALSVRERAWIDLPTGDRMYVRVDRVGYQTLEPMERLSSVVRRCVDRLDTEMRADSDRILRLDPGPPPTTPGKVTHYLVQWGDGEYGLVYYTGMCWALRSLTSQNVDDAIAYARLPNKETEC